MSTYAIGIKFMKGVPQPKQRPFWRVYFLALTPAGKAVQFFDDFDDIARWAYLEGAEVRRLEDLATDELMELPAGWWALLQQYLAAGAELRGVLDRAR